MEEENKSFKLFSANTLLYLILIAILGNLFILDVAIFGEKGTEQKQTVITQIITPTEKPEAEINEARPNFSPTPTTIPQTSNSTSVNTAGEFYIPLGAGSSTETEWKDVPGVQAYVNSALYKNIEKVTFEASLYTPTGNQIASARLYNVTDGHVVWNSEVTIEGGNPQLRISPNIILSSGSKLYQVQMKTQVGSRTNLENARIHIITK